MKTMFIEANPFEPVEYTLHFEILKKISIKNCINKSYKNSTREN